MWLLRTVLLCDCKAVLNVSVYVFLYVSGWFLVHLVFKVVVSTLLCGCKKCFSFFTCCYVVARALLYSYKGFFNILLSTSRCGFFLCVFNTFLCGC